MDVDDWKETLELCGVAQEEAQDAIVASGCADIIAMAKMTEEEVTEMVKYIVKNKKFSTGHSANRHEENVKIPYMAIKNLKALRDWAVWRIRQGYEPGELIFDESELNWTLERRTFEATRKAVLAENKDKSAKKPTLLKSFVFTKWRKWSLDLKAYLNQVYGAMNLPFTYLLREHDEPTETMKTELTTWSDEDLMATVMFNDDNGDYKRDNKELWTILKDHVGEEIYPHIKRLEAKQDGRAAYVALAKQAEGTAGKTARMNTAYNSLKTIKYTGQSKNFTYDDYITKFMEVFTELELLGEKQSEAHKVHLLLQGFQHPDHGALISGATANSDLMNSFENMQQHLKSSLITLGTLDSKSDSRQIAASKKGQRRGGGHRGNPNQKNRKNGAYIPPGEWKKMSKKQRQKVFEARGEKGRKNEDKKSVRMKKPKEWTIVRPEISLALTRMVSETIHALARKARKRKTRRNDPLLTW
jgi:hypothetical protein